MIGSRSGSIVQRRHYHLFSPGFVIQATWNYQNLPALLTVGIGLIIYVNADKADEVLHALQTGPEAEAYIVGDLVRRYDQPAVILDGVDHWRRRT